MPTSWKPSEVVLLVAALISAALDPGVRGATCPLGYYDFLSYTEGNAGLFMLRPLGCLVSCLIPFGRSDRGKQRSRSDYKWLSVPDGGSSRAPPLSIPVPFVPL